MAEMRGRERKGEEGSNARRQQSWRAAEEVELRHAESQRWSIILNNGHQKSIKVTNLWRL